MPCCPSNNGTRFRSIEPSAHTCEQTNAIDAILKYEHKCAIVRSCAMTTNSVATRQGDANYNANRARARDDTGISNDTSHQQVWNERNHDDWAVKRTRAEEDQEKRRGESPTIGNGVDRLHI